MNALSDFLAAFSVFFTNTASMSVPNFPQTALSAIFAYQNASCRIFDYYRFKKMQCSVLVNKLVVPGRDGGGGGRGGRKEKMRRIYCPAV